ncbi:MAG TPA: hypothetical protein VMA36_13555 [Candidatus Limnocylindria bacterium]|nr:hypothetical protein [Candidatus Limnocylindria bacterium]
MAQLWLAYVDANGFAQLATFTLDDGTWGPPSTIALPPELGPLQPDGPLALAFDGAQTLWLAYVQQRAIYVAGTDADAPGVAWSEPVRAGELISGANAVTACCSGSTLNIGYLDVQLRPSTTWRDASGAWADPQTIGAAPAPSAQPPSLATWNGKRWFAYQEAESTALRLVVNDGQSWSAELLLSTGAVAKTGPAIAVVDSQLWIAYIGVTSGGANTYFMCSDDGLFWTEPYLTQGNGLAGGAPTLIAWQGGTIGSHVSAAACAFGSTIDTELVIPYPKDVGSLPGGGGDPAIAGW